MLGKTYICCYEVMSMLPPANSYDVRCPKMAAVCILRCTEHPIQTRLLCVYIDAPSMRIKPGCSVHTSMRRACVLNQVALCILRCAEQVYRKSKLHACLLKRFYDSPSLYVSLQHWILSMHARKNTYLLL